METLPAAAPSILPELLTRRGRLRAKHAEDGERYRAGIIYIAPPDRHLLIEPNGKLLVVRGPLPPAAERRFFRLAGLGAVGVIQVGTLAFLLRADTAIE